MRHAAKRIPKKMQKAAVADKSKPPATLSAGGFDYLVYLYASLHARLYASVKYCSKGIFV